MANKRPRSWDDDFERQTKRLVDEKIVNSSNSETMQQIFGRTKDLLFEGARQLYKNSNGNEPDSCPALPVPSTENIQNMDEESQCHMKLDDFRRCPKSRPLEVIHKNFQLLDDIPSGPVEDIVMNINNNVGSEIKKDIGNMSADRKDSTGYKQLTIKHFWSRTHKERCAAAGIGRPLDIVQYSKRNLQFSRYNDENDSMETD